MTLGVISHPPLFYFLHCQVQFCAVLHMVMGSVPRPPQPPRLGCSTSGRSLSPLWQCPGEAGSRGWHRPGSWWAAWPQSPRPQPWQGRAGELGVESSHWSGAGADGSSACVFSRLQGTEKAICSHPGTSQPRQGCRDGAAV